MAGLSFRSPIRSFIRVTRDPSSSRLSGRRASCFRYSFQPDRLLQMLPPGRIGGVAPRLGSIEPVRKAVLTPLSTSWIFGRSPDRRVTFRTALARHEQAPVALARCRIDDFYGEND